MGEVGTCTKEGIVKLVNQTAEGQERVLLEQVREIYGRMVYTHKTQEKEADRWHRWDVRQRWVLVVLTALGSATFLTALLGAFIGERWSGLVTSFVALLVSGLSLAAKELKFSQRTEAHRDCAVELWNLRESYLSLIADLTSGAMDLERGRARRDELQEQTAEVLAAAPRTTTAAYDQAGEALKNKEELTFSSAEIDPLLPEALRLNEPEPDETAQSDLNGEN
jgi:hypothetical protein